MAETTVYIPDEKIIDYIKSKFELDPGKANPNIEVRVTANPPTENNTMSHLVEVTLRYGLELGEIGELAEI